jgi:hypothetical protein
LVAAARGAVYSDRVTVDFETLFPLEQILATPGALAALAEANSNRVVWILKHAAL